MTQATDTLEDQAAVLRLSRLECLQCENIEELKCNCRTCGCTGLAFWELSEECPCPAKHVIERCRSCWDGRKAKHEEYGIWDNDFHSETCSECQGTRRVPVSVEVAESRLMRRREFNDLCRTDFPRGHEASWNGELGIGRSSITALESAILSQRGES